jgi:orotidine-5'-phosphate decarboxylase
MSLYLSSTAKTTSANSAIMADAVSGLECMRSQRRVKEQQRIAEICAEIEVSKPEEEQRRAALVRQLHETQVASFAAEKEHNDIVETLRTAQQLEKENKKIWKRMFKCLCPVRSGRC